MQAISSRIWTWIAVSISNRIKHYTTSNLSNPEMSIQWIIPDSLIYWK